MKKIVAVLLLSSFSIYSYHGSFSHEPYSQIKQQFELYNAWGIETQVDLYRCDPKIIRSKDAIQDYVIELCNLIEMKRYGDTWIEHFGEDERVAGFSMSQPIETSLISGHFANETNNVYINIFSCKLYDPYVAAAFTKTFFKAESLDIHIVLR